MMRKSLQRATLRTPILALGLLAGASAGVHAAPVMTYSTSGAIDSTGVTGAPVISFNSVASGSVDTVTPTNLSLGAFQVAGLLGDQFTTYKDTPFHITFLVNQVDGQTPDPNQTPIQISGVLNATIIGNNQSSVTATFDPPNAFNFQTGIQDGLQKTLYDNTLAITSPKSLVASTTNGGRTSAEALITTLPHVPEPTSVAVFLMSLGGLGLHHRLRRRA